MAVEQYIPPEELGAVQDVPQTEVVPEETTEARPSFDPAALTDEEIAAVLAHERAKPLVERLAQSEADRRLELARQRAWKEQLAQQKAAEDSRRRALVLDPEDEDAAKDQLYAEERQRILNEQRQAEVQRAAAQMSAQEIQRLFIDLPATDKVELSRLAGEVYAGRLTEEQLWDEAMARRDRAVQSKWAAERKASEEEARRISAAEAQAAAVTTPRPRPDLGSGRGGGPMFTSLREAEAAHARGEISNEEMRGYRRSLSY